jgi:acetolactate synthase-1/2/3 large subunit
LADKLGIAIAPAWNAQDLVPDDHPLYVGRPGTVGDRSGNFAVQCSDLLLVLGCRLNIRQISYNYAGFAPNAKKIMIDVDAPELFKPTISIDMPIHADLRTFIPALIKTLDGYEAPSSHRTYVDWAMERRRRYPAVLPEYWETQGVVNPYCFTESLFDQLEPDEVIVMADATAAVVTVQAAKLKKGQRLYSNSGAASMGYDLPATIGAWHAMPPSATRIICLAGDGSIMQNLQELQTIVGQGIPAKVFLYNNSGYHSIRQTQQAYFDGHSVGCGPDSGVTFPDFGKVAKAFGFAYTRTSEHEDMARAISDTLATPGAALCEIFIDKDQNFAPKVSSRRLEDGSMVTAPLHDLAPFLPREELAEAMRVPE